MSDPLLALFWFEMDSVKVAADFARVMHELDEAVDEAARLRQAADAALQREKSSYFPERRLQQRRQSERNDLLRNDRRSCQVGHS